MQTSLPQRDATGKFVPQAPEKWLQRSQEKAKAYQQRLERLAAEHNAWGAALGLTVDEMAMMFA